MNLFLPKLLSVVVLLTATEGKLEQKLVPGSWGITVTELAMLFRGGNSGRFWKFELEKLLSASSLIGCSVGAWKIRVLRAV